MTKLKFNSKNVKWLAIVFVMILALSIPTYSWMKESNYARAQRIKSNVSPIIMVPGSSATVNRFDPLIRIINKDNPRPHSVLKIQVNENGKMEFRGSINKGDLEPIIVIGFQNNHDGYSNIKKQTEWLDLAFYRISETYKFNNFKAFGHSNGGLIWTYWLEHYYSEYKDEIMIKRLMTLASPFNFNESVISHRTQMLNDFIKYRKNLPKDLKVYSLLGGETLESDGLVPEESVHAAKYIFQGQVAAFTEMMVTGDKAGHSDLTENKQIVAVMEQYLFNKNPQANNPANSNNKKKQN